MEDGFCACEKISSNYSVRFSLALSYRNSSLLILSGFILSSFDSSNANSCSQPSWHNRVNSVGTRNRLSCKSCMSIVLKALDALRNVLPYLDEGFGYAVEVRHRSWFQDLAYNLCQQ